MTIIADIHTHTLASGHAYSTLKENAEQALYRGLDFLGVSDHTPGMPNTTCAGYWSNLKVIRGSASGVRMLKGAEANIMDAQGRIDLSDDIARRLDYVIASLHDSVVSNMGIAANTQAVIQAMKNPYVKVIGHPDDDGFPLDYAALASATKAHGVALELNNSSLTPHSSRSGGERNARKMLEVCMRVGAPIMVGSDSHIWYDVGEFGHAISLLEGCGFPQELVLNADRERFEAFMTPAWLSREIAAG